MDHRIQPLHVNGLAGRVLHIPGPNKSSPEVLFIYGHHSSIERWQGIAELVAQHAAATMPDLPGFGGMQSLYKIGKPATLDNLADYLADFIRQHYKGKTFAVIGMSLGFVIVTRMLQRHPDITKSVKKLVSLFGFAHKDDFILPEKRYKFLLRGSYIFSLPILATLYRLIALNRFVLERSYHKTPNAREKFKGLTPAQQAENLQFEIKLWHNDDTRTYMKTAHEFLTLDNTKAKVNLPVYHIAVHNDRYFNNASVQKHLEQIFSDYKLLVELKSSTHAPTAVRTAAEAKQLIPPELLQQFD